MPLPLALTTAATILQIGGKAFSFFSGMSAANKTEREGRRLAGEAIERGEEDVRRYTLNLNQILGAQRADIGAQGIDTTQGTAAMLRAETEAFGAEDIAQIRENAMRESYALRRGLSNQASAIRGQAIGEGLGAASLILDAGANAWDSYSRRRAQTRAVTNNIGTIGADPAWF
jgi:hypothetical protein